jgi:DNA-binding NarL/FixJ family response regulator
MLCANLEFARQLQAYFDRSEKMPQFFEFPGSNRQRGLLDTSSIRVLVVDDYEPWHLFITTTLLREPHLQLVGQAFDGLQAVDQAQELQPDLILLDMGLPSLNGLQAARRIREVSPESRIVFVTETRSRELAEAALSAGAGGYVVKSDALRELLPAVNAVLAGKQFLSASLDGHHGLDNHQPQHAAHHLRQKGASEAPPVRHEVEFYANDAAFVNGFVRAIEAALKAGNSVVVIASESHRAAILEKARVEITDFNSLFTQGRFSQIDNRVTLSRYMVNDLPDPLLCAEAVGELVSAAAKAAPQARVSICGECAPALLADGNPDAAIRVEQLWDELTRRHGADTLCGYLWSHFPQGRSGPVFERICAAHSAVHGHHSGP